MATRRRVIQGGLLLATVPLAACATSLDRANAKSRLLYQDNFRNGLAQWHIEAQEPAIITASTGVLEIDTPEGLTAWFRPKLSGAVKIEYDALAVSEGGRNDRVSDLNAFWMATDSRSPGDMFANPRSGAFADYDATRTYYVGQGGNYNKTTRFRRYIGTPGNRPILPEHDLSAPEHMLRPNVWQTVTLIADGPLIQYWRDGVKVFELNDAEPYTAGWFGIRTTKSHLRIRNLRIFRL